MFNQQIPPALAVAEQSLHFRERRRLDLPALWVIRPAPSP
jgi:hypothetical protein